MKKSPVRTSRILPATWKRLTWMRQKNKMIQSMLKRPSQMKKKLPKSRPCLMSFHLLLTCTKCSGRPSEQHSTATFPMQAHHLQRALDIFRDAIRANNRSKKRQLLITELLPRSDWSLREIKSCFVTNIESNLPLTILNCVNNYLALRLSRA